MTDVSELLNGFEKLKKKTLLVKDRKSIIDDSFRFLGSHISDIIAGRTRPAYDGARLVQDLISFAIQELDRSSSKSFKREAFDLAIKFVPKAILADAIEAEDVIVIQWYHRVCSSPFADQLFEAVLPSVHAYFATVTPAEIPGNHVVELWRDLWSRFSSLHSAELQSYTTGLISGLLSCLCAILKNAKHTLLVDQPWNLVRTVIDGLGMRREDSKLWQRNRVASFSHLLQLLRHLLHGWGFTYRTQLVGAMEGMIKAISSSIEYDSSMHEWRNRPWNEISLNSCTMEHAWLLLEEYAALAAPKACPILVPDGVAPGDFALCEMADTLVIKFAKLSTSSSSCPPASRAACRLTARAMVAQHRLQSTGGSTDEDAAAAAGPGCSTQLSSFNRMKLASQYASQFSTQMGTNSTQRSQYCTQRILKRRKRKRDVRLLQSMASLDLSSLLEDCTHSHSSDPPMEWSRYAIECMTVVMEEHLEDLGGDAPDIIQMMIASTKKITKDELIPSIARLLCTVMEKRVMVERRESLDVEDPGAAGKRRSSSSCSTTTSSDAAVVSELWSRAHSWTHSPLCFEWATRLMRECDRWLLSSSIEIPQLPQAIRWTRMMEVIKSAPSTSSAAVSLLQHALARYEYNEREEGLRRQRGGERKKGEKWSFRSDVVRWLLGRDPRLQIAGAIVAACSYYPKEEKREEVEREENPWINQECRMRALVRTQLDGEGRREERDERPDVLIREVVEETVERMREEEGRAGLSNAAQLRRLCVLQRLSSRMKRAGGAEGEPLKGSSTDILAESLMGERTEREEERMEGLEDARWEACQWFESHGVHALDAQDLLIHLQHEEVLDGLPDMIYSALSARLEGEEAEEDKRALAGLTAVMRQFMMEEGVEGVERMVSALDAIASLPCLRLVDHTRRRLGDVVERLAEIAESVGDVQTMIYKYAHLVLPETRARLIDRMSTLVDEEREEEGGACYTHHMEETIIAHYAMEIPLEYAMTDLDRADVMERVLTPEALLSRLQLEADRGELTGECEELVKACLSPGRWHDHFVTVELIGRWPELMKRCLFTQPLLGSIMDEMAAAIDIDTVIKKEMKEEIDEENDENVDTHKNYIDIENLWTPAQREISRVCRELRLKEEGEDSFMSTSSLTDTALPSALLLPRREWKVMGREWERTERGAAITIVHEYGKRCFAMGMELRLLAIVEYLMGQRAVESSPTRFILETLAEAAVMGVRGRCTERSTDFIRATATWSRIRSRLRLCTPSSVRVARVMDAGRRMKREEWGEQPSVLMCTADWWEHAEREMRASPSPTLRSSLIDAYRTLHEARCVPPRATTVLPLIVDGGETRELTRSSFTPSSFLDWLRVHCELWWYERRAEGRSGEEIEMILSVYEDSPVGSVVGEEGREEEGGFERDIVGRLLLLAHQSATDGGWRRLMKRMGRVMGVMNLHYECLPYLITLCPDKEAIELLLMSSSDLVEEREEEKKRGKKGRCGDIALIIEECVRVVGMDVLAEVCSENGRDAEQPLLDLAKLAIDSGVMSLARVCVELTTDSCLPNRPHFLFEDSFALPECLEETRKSAVMVTRDAVTARSLSSSTQAQDEIRRILAESRFDWHLSSSDEARAALDQETENYLLRFTEWTSFSKRLERREDALNGVLVLMEREEQAARRVGKGLRSSIAARLSASSSLLSKEVAEDTRVRRLMRVVVEEEESEAHCLLPSSLHAVCLQKSQLDEHCLLRVGTALARWKRKSERRGGGKSEELLSKLHSTHEKVAAAARHLEGVKAYKPALRLLSRWSSMVEGMAVEGREREERERVRRRVRVDEARIRVEMGEEYVGLHAIGELRREEGVDAETLALCSFLEADIVLSKTRNREEARRKGREALTALASAGDGKEAERMRHEAHRRVFEQTALLLEETSTIMESRGFLMKREAIEEWRYQLEEIEKRRQEADRKTKLRLEREMACEKEEIARMESRMTQLASECIVAGLDALRSAPDTTSSSSAEILFPLLDVLFKYGQTEEVGAIFKQHVAHADCVYFVQGVGHLVGHVFKETPITKPLRLLLARLVMFHPYHTIPRLLFYYRAGGDEEQNIRKIIELATARKEGLKEHVERIVKAHYMFRDFTSADVKDRTLFSRGIQNGKECYRMNKDTVSLLRDKNALSLVPVPTMHLEPGKSIDTVPHIVDIVDVFSQADGLSLPKQLTFRTSDGVERKMICKKEDVRQDAMVEHLFEAVNNILNEASGGQRGQELRTYKVVPLDADNGLIEFCGGTISLKDLLCAADRQGGLHREIYPDDITAKEAYLHLAQANAASKLQAFREICDRFSPVFRFYFYRSYSSPREWSERIDAYRRSLAQWSIVCYIVGLGDRHASNVLFEPATAKFVHIDLGMILEYSKRSLPVPERVPFRLTRDLVDPLIADGLDGHFTNIAVETIVALRKKSSVLLGIASALLRENMSNFEEAAPSKDSSLIAKAAIGRLREKLAGTDAGFAPQTAEEQVRRLIKEATNEHNLATIFHGWMPFM